VEARLHETEELLFRIVSSLSSEELSKTLLASPVDPAAPIPSHSKPFPPDRRELMEQWAAFPLKTSLDVQRWHEAHSEATCPAPSQTYQPTHDSAMPDLPFDMSATRGGEPRSPKPDKNGRSITNPTGEQDSSIRSLDELHRETGGSALQNSDKIQHTPNDDQQMSQSGVTSSLGLSSEFQADFLW
jgi:hypothetical protein